MTNHPARYSQAIIDHFAKILDGCPHVHDPFGGDGVRLGQLCDRLQLPFSGTEIEEAFIIDPRVKVGDSTQRRTYPRKDRRFWIVTSPVYPNGIADYFFTDPTKEAKDWNRNTYRHRKAEMVGDRMAELDASNMARYGYRGTSENSGKRADYWRLANDAVACWGNAELVVLNVSDFMVKDDIEPIIEPWIETLGLHGWQVSKIDYVKTPRNRHGSDESRNQRVAEGEAIIVARRG